MIRREVPLARSSLVVLMMVGASIGCSGVNLSLGTGANASSPGGFYQVFEVPATSVRPWVERTQLPPLAPPPEGGPSSVTTLPAGPGSSGKLSGS